MTLIYAGIGSRETPAEILEVMETIAFNLAQAGWLLRSGHADGADLAFERAAMEGQGATEIYVPWRRFNSEYDYGANLIVPDFNKRLMDLAEAHHPAWDRCSVAAQKLHARNCCQVLGEHLDKPADMVICWTPKGSGSGGTGQAIRIAHHFNVPVFDLGNGDNWKRLEHFVDHIN